MRTNYAGKHQILLPRVGVASRGSGFWVGNPVKDPDNPDRDDPKKAPANSLQYVETYDDLLNDEELSAFRARRTLAASDRKRLLLTHKEYALRRKLHKAFEFAKEAQMDLLSADPGTMTPEQLVSASERINIVMKSATPMEQRIFMSQAERIRNALNQALQAKAHADAQKAILTKPNEEKTENKVKRAKKPLKTKKKEVNTKGKTAYKYDKKDGGKGKAKAAEKAGKAQAAQKKAANPSKGSPMSQSAPQADPSMVSPPAPVDIKAFAKRLGIKSSKIRKLAEKKSRSSFVRYFMKMTELAERHGFNQSFLESLYDALVHPATAEGAPPPQPAPQPQAAAPGAKPKPKQPVAKSTFPSWAEKRRVKFIAKGIKGLDDKQTLGMLQMLADNNVRTLGGMRQLFQKHYTMTEDAAMRMTRSLVVNWERQGIATLERR